MSFDFSPSPASASRSAISPPARLTAKQLVQERLPAWSEEDAEIPLRAVELQIVSILSSHQRDMTDTHNTRATSQGPRQQDHV